MNFLVMGLLLLDLSGGLAMDRSITAAVVGRHMDPIVGRQYPMDMGDARAREITSLFQHLAKNTMSMGSTLGGFCTRFAALSNPTPKPEPKGAPMTKSTTLKSATLAFALIIAGIAQASAQGATMQEKMACRADAESFCSQFIGKAPQMRACLEQNKAKLSTPCRQVVESHGG
jgi:hypothetical protein